LREDAGFHAYQMLEAGVRQFTAWGNTDAGRHILIAVARYLAAHSPTERAALQTADIARRLMLGAELHQEAGASCRRMPSVRDGSGSLVGLEIVGSARDPATGEKCNRMQRSNAQAIKLHYVSGDLTLMDRIDPCDLLGLLDRLDIEIDHDGFVVAAHKDT